MIMRNLEDLSIIIPTYERESFAIRTINYWAGKEPSVIVLDGSKQALNENYLKSYNDNISYIHLPNHTYQERISKLNNLVNTKYCMLHPDDEFFIPSGLSACIEEIEKEDLVCCLGRCLEFEFKNNRVECRPWSPLHTSFDNYSLMEEKPIMRVLKHMHPYLCSTIYGVTKTNVLLNNISVQIDNTIENYFFELSYEICSAYQGKSKVINQLSWLRSNENKPFYIKDKEQGNRDIEPYELILDVQFKENLVIEKLAECLNRINDEYSLELLKEIIYSSLSSYAYQANLTINTANFLKDNKTKDTPDKNILKKLLGSSYYNKELGRYNSLINSAKIWNESGIRSNPKEINEIESLISDFHQKKYISK